MKTLFFSLSLIASLFPLSNAVPTPTQPEERQLVEDVTSDLAALVTEVSGLVTCIVGNVITDLEIVVATAIPDAVTAASSTLAAILTTSPTPTNIVEFAAELVAAGLTLQNVGSAVDFVEGALSGLASDTNANIDVPSVKIYPKASEADAPYDLTEDALREAIYIPSTFQYGKGPQPLILVPGTGANGYTTFIGNYIPLLLDSDIADIVWLNIPDFLLNDAQANAEYVAYAIHYISAISGNVQVAVAAWSQGNIDAQWAYKYWPSTRELVTDHIAFSPDYHGTYLANFLSTPCEDLPPSILQQEYTSNFITTLRADGGDSAYVPTTTVYSGILDEIVEPQQGTGASAYLLDERGVGVTNNEVQNVCAVQPAGTFYTHEGVLYNPIGYALLVDALAHDGPGQVSRLDLSDICGDYLTPGLDLTDLLLTENAILIAAIAILVYPESSNVEPPIKAYALLNETFT